jgi:hypothetical protein
LSNPVSLRIFKYVFSLVWDEDENSLYGREGMSYSFGLDRWRYLVGLLYFSRPLLPHNLHLLHVVTK